MFAWRLITVLVLSAALPECLGRVVQGLSLLFITVMSKGTVAVYFANWL